MVAVTSRETSGRLLNRELSTLEYNGRLLDLAADESLPLFERLKMCRFFSSNLDEFFMVRVAGLTEQEAAGIVVRSADGLTPRGALAAIREHVLELTARESKLWKKHLCPALAAEGILITNADELDEDERRALGEGFQREIFPVLTPLAVSPGQRFPYISGLTLSLGVLARDPETGEERFARVKVPEGLPRFFAAGNGKLLMLEDVIAHFLDRLFPGMEIVERSVFRITRDADFEVSDDADDLLEAVEQELQRRRFGDAVRLEVSTSTSRGMLERLQQGLGVGDDQVYEIHGPLDLADLDQLLDLDRPELAAPLSPGATPARLVHAKEPRDLFDEIRRGDFLVHQPYESFAGSFEAFVRAAARDPDVIAMKTAVYRTSGDSPLVPALIALAEDGKQSVCLVELKARFDEHRNIEWSRALEQAGVHVVYGFADLKVHAKMTLVVRRESDGLRRYVHVGTGNYHAVTARSYEDLSLFTADPEIAEDVAALFNYLTGFGRPERFRKILVAPFNLRARLIDRIRAAGAAAAAGTKATDPDQAERAHRRGRDRGAVRRLRAGRADRDRVALDLHAPPRRPRDERERPGALDRRALSRAQPRVRVRDRGRDGDVPRQRRPDDAQPRPPRRGARAGRAAAAEAGADGGLRQRVRRHGVVVGARRRRHLDAPQALQGGARARSPAQPAAPREGA